MSSLGRLQLPTERTKSQSQREREQVEQVIAIRAFHREEAAFEKDADASREAMVKGLFAA
jgi:hypothetical protein